MKPISVQQSVTCHVGSHSVTCHPTERNALTPARQTGNQLTYLRGMKTELNLSVGAG